MGKNGFQAWRAPRRRRRGRIEAPPGWPRHGRRRSAPRRRRRGRIEAHRPAHLLTTPLEVLHGGDAVAELKLVSQPALIVATVVLHGGDAVAELKPAGAVGVVAEVRRCSTAATPWPN